MKNEERKKKEREKKEKMKVGVAGESGDVGEKWGVRGKLKNFFYLFLLVLHIAAFLKNAAIGHS